VNENDANDEASQHCRRQTPAYPSSQSIDGGKQTVGVKGYLCMVASEKFSSVDAMWSVNHDRVYSESHNQCWRIRFSPLGKLADLVIY